MEPMTAEKSPPGWMPLTLLSQRFNANAAALASRDRQLAEATGAFSPAEPYSMKVSADRIDLAVGTGESFRMLPAVLGAPAAPAVARKLCPTAKLAHPVLVAGDDQGWLWNEFYRMPTDAAWAPGYRTPIYLLLGSVERLWVMMHLQDWQTMLADARVRLFVGPDCLDRFEAALMSELTIPRPMSSITVDPALWGGKTLQSILQSVVLKQFTQLNQLTMPDPVRAAAILDQFRTGRPLRILGVTSRYTTFIQHSMRDWLAAFESLGHTTRLLIETADHQIPNNLWTAELCHEFQPDLVVAIDHGRRTVTGIPPHVPVVMWVQDRLTNIYDVQTGTSQGPLDFVLGYGRLELTKNFNYPPSRFMPTMMATNDKRFTPAPRPSAELDRFRCDVSYVSHASASADSMFVTARDKMEQPQGRALFDDLYQQLRGIYDDGGAVSSGGVIVAMIRRTLENHRLKTEEAGLIELFTHRLNNAMFRHQALQWVADSGANLHLYGRGWEKHPTLAKCARGEADHAAELHAIYQASAINLQVTPFGAVHQRLLDGLAAGGFFLMRSVTADELELLRKRMWDWCVARRITTGGEMSRRADAAWAAAAGRYAELGAIDPRVDPETVYAEMQECALTGFTRTPQTLFADAGAVTFSTRDELLSRMSRFLKSPAERASTASAMRDRVVQAHTYHGITKRLVDFIRRDLQSNESVGRLAA